jgi:hypothetical protein
MEKNHMKLQLAATIVLASTATASAGYWTGHDLHDACQRTPGFVTGYVTGWKDKWSADHSIIAESPKVHGAPELCLSRDLSASQLTTAYCQYLLDHQDALSRSSDDLLIDAFGESFPCRQ